MSIYIQPHDLALVAALLAAFAVGVGTTGVAMWLWFLRAICGLTWRDVLADAWAAMRR